jgi:alpha-L-fucosidase
MQHSESLKELATALAAAHGEIENATKNSTNPHFRSKYADLAEIINTTRPVLSKHGLSVVQIPGFADGVVTVDTMLLHKSGEWVQHTSGAPIGKADAQGVGSATTYLRRYSLAAVCGIAQEDDDAESAVSNSPQRSQPARQNGNAPRQATAKQKEYLGKLLASSVFTADERTRLQGALDAGEGERVSKAIEWAKDELEARKAIQAEEMAGAA